MSDRKQKQLTFDVYNSWEIPARPRNQVFIESLPRPIWTETKAQLIHNYLRYFLWVTKHGCYIDGFAGPQDTSNPNSWAAKLVLEMKPCWFRNIYLSDKDTDQYNHLQELVSSQPEVKNRSIETRQVDFNEWIDTILNSGIITDTTATFALLDQRSMECDWHTLEKLAEHKKGETKIELFYFFPTGWLHRVLSTKNDADIQRWWGREDWNKLTLQNQANAAHLMTERIQDLGYFDVKAWQICEREGGQGRTMYHMIHATDHMQAPLLMDRSYRKLVATPDEQKTIDMWEAKNIVDSDE